MKNGIHVIENIFRPQRLTQIPLAIRYKTQTELAGNVSNKRGREIRTPPTRSIRRFTGVEKRIFFVWIRIKVERSQIHCAFIAIKSSIIYYILSYKEMTIAFLKSYLTHKNKS